MGHFFGVGEAFDGALLGDEESATATTSTEDTDLGNYQLYEGSRSTGPCSMCSGTR
jgi:hypothetical protein